MPANIKRLKACGVSSADWKQKFTLKPADRKAKFPRLDKLVELMADRFREGIRNNLSEWRAYYAIDLAYNSPFAQTTPTLLGHIMGQNLSNEQTVKALQDFGLTEKNLFMEIENPKKLGQVLKVLNPPVFFEVVVPLVKAYGTIRDSKMFNDRNNSPLFPYNPVHRTSADRVRCAIITDMVNLMAGQYGYASVLRQGIHQQNKYGVMLAFPREEWHCEEQEDADGNVYTVREGIRYIMPHPSRMAADLTYPWTSFNSDSGCEWGLHWHVTTYGQIFDNRMYWNRNAIFCGNNWFQHPGAERYFSEVFPCTMNFPKAQGGTFTREDKAAWYSTANRDQSVFIGEQFVRLIPRDWDLGNYKYPVWCRFTLAGDDTVIFGSPCGYNPIWFMGYDYDENNDVTSSLALECIPWQDIVGNLLSQIILTAKNNLANTIFYDVQQVNKSDIEALQGLGESRYRSTQYIGYDSMKARVSMHDKREAFQNVAFAKMSTAELMQLMPLVLSIMERVLQISAQESGTTAAHYQSKFEVQQTGGAVNTRLAFTGSYTDEGIDAWKRQLVHGCLAYRDPDSTAEIPADMQDVDKHLQEMGFRVISRNPEKIVVRGPKHKVLQLEVFAATNQGPDQGHDKEIAGIIFQAIGITIAQPEIVQKVGVANLVHWIEEATKLAGGPADFKLPISDQAQGDKISPALQQALEALQQTIMQAVQEKVSAPAAQAVAQVQSEVAQQSQAIEQLKKIFEVAQKATDAAQVKVDQTAQQIQLDEAKARSEHDLKSAETTAAISRADKVAASDIARKDAVAVADVAIKAKVAAAKPKTKPKA
jgi:hypothetical protein